MDTGQVWEDFTTLPIDAQQQVADLIASLQRHAPIPPEKMPAKTPPLEREPFIGMWSDRTDMQDSTAWVHDQRKREWTR